MWEVHGVRVDPEQRRVWRDGVEVTLSRKELELLIALIRRAGAIVSRPQLMLEVWQMQEGQESKTLEVHLGWLRRKLGDDPKQPQLIRTYRGRGLRFEVADPSN